MSSGNQRYINTVGTHNITMGDDFINVSTSVGAITLVFPNIRDSGAINSNKVWFVNDVDDMAATNNVTIVASDTSPVTELNGGTSVVLDTNGFSAEIVPSGYYSYMVNSGISDGGMTGSGTLNYVAKFTPSGTILGNSQLFDNGVGVALGTNSPFNNSLFSIKGVDATSTNYWIKTQDSDTSPLFYGKNNGYIGFGCDPANAKFEFSGGNILLLTFGARFGSIAVGGYSSWGLAANEISTLPVSTGTHLILQYTELGNVGIGTNAPTSRLQVVGLNEYADNAAAITAGLTAGAFYRTGDLLKVCH